MEKITKHMHKNTIQQGENLSVGMLEVVFLKRKGLSKDEN